MKKQDEAKLRLWQERLSKNQSVYDAEIVKMDAREALCRGESKIRAMVEGERKKKTPHVRNIASELIESQVDSTIPQPKVSAVRREDEGLAKIIENMLRNELDRLPFEMINDMQERTVPMQGGGVFLVEWDNTLRTHTTVGELTVSALHPKQLVPQDGVYTSIEDMDFVILKLPQTKAYIKSRYKVDVGDEAESEPDTRGSGDDSAADDMVTQYIGYERNARGGIALFSWVNDTVLEDLDDYQARRLRRCTTCGAAEPIDGVTAAAPTANGLNPTMTGADETPDGLVYQPPALSEPVKAGRVRCPYCGGSEWEERAEEYEELYEPVTRSDGSTIPGAEYVTRLTGEVDDLGLPAAETVREPNRVPYYKPDIFPVILQRSVSVFGQLLGDSDIDKIADQQNTINRMEAKIIDKLLKSGSYITLPDSCRIEVNAEDMKIIRPANNADMAMIKVHDLQGNVEQDMLYLSQVYEESRQAIGVTDSFQGRVDRTATSGKAKEFAAAQSAGRLESKRVMKNAAYAALFEAMFKFKLAYADEPRPVTSKNVRGDTEYGEFNRYDFLRQDAAGEWYWNDQFLFSCDTSAPLANNREAMWQETRMNLQSGAFGDPAQLTTLILFWTKMEQLHYPGASDTKTYLEEQLSEQRETAAAYGMAGQAPGMAVAAPDVAGQAPGMAGRKLTATPPSAGAGGLRAVPRNMVSDVSADAGTMI